MRIMYFLRINFTVEGIVEITKRLDSIVSNSNFDDVSSLFIMFLSKDLSVPHDLHDTTWIMLLIDWT